ncbi:MAG TPA: hypothetical protein VND42_05820 [Candidatus Acidoferrales bacterium]|nr:hypothetical protein [Candidatus Acidoferrales bacterium]
MKSRGSKLVCFAVLLLSCVPSSFAQSPASEASPGDGQGATLTFRKIFKSSYPEFAEIKVNEDGSGTYDIRQLDDTSSPQPMQIGPALAHKMFELAAELHNFNGIDLDVHRRIADLGQKTFGYQKGSEKFQVTFNYTLNSAANQLLAIFDGLQRQELDLSDLVRTMHYDHLGVNDVITRVQQDVKNKLLPEPEALLPTLDQVAANEELVDIARQRARAIAEQIRSHQ